MPEPSCRHPPYTPTELLGTGCFKSEPIISRGSWYIVCRLSNNVANPCTPQACLQPPALAYNRTGGTRPLCLPLKPDERCGDAVYARISESGLPRPDAPYKPPIHSTAMSRRQRYVNMTGTCLTGETLQQHCYVYGAYTALRDARVIWQE